jgi:hypothetical protein
VAAKPPRRSQPVVIDRNGFAPGDGGKSQREQQEHERANGIEMGCRIETDAAEHTRGVIAEHPGGPGVHEFMHGDRDEERDDHRHEEDGIDLAKSGHGLGHY